MKYKITARFETRLIIAGMLYSPNDCKIPTKENARPVQIIIGNIIDERCIASLCVSLSKLGAIR